MRQDCIVERQIDYQREAIELVFRIVNGMSYRELKIDILKRTEKEQHKSIEKLLDMLIEIEEGMKPHINLQDKRIQYFFKLFSGDELCIAKILYQGMSYGKLETDDKSKKKVLADWLKRIVEDDSIELTLVKNELIGGYYEDGKKVPFIERVQRLECEEAKKWELLYLLVHAKEQIDELFELLVPIIKKLCTYKEKVNKLMDDCADYWEKYLQKEKFLVLINHFYGLTENSYPEMTAYIRPQIMDCDHMVFIGNDETMGDYHILEIGIIFDKNFEAAKKRPTKEQICNGMKLLSDPSKFEILRSINGKKAYGQELAAMTNLTTATISHHMNALMGFGFITIEKVDNKVFYTMNKQVIKEFLLTAMDVLVEEESNEV